MYDEEEAVPCLEQALVAWFPVWEAEASLPWEVDVLFPPLAQAFLPWVLPFPLSSPPST